MKKTVAGLVLAVWSMSVFAHDIKVSNAWARATVAGQTSAGVFMEIQSVHNAMLIRADTVLGNTTQLHEMKMQGDVMKMYPVKHVLLQANKPVVFQPGGLHVMILGLKKPLKAGKKLPLKLTFEFADKRKETVLVNAEVVAQTATGIQTAD